MKQRYYILLDNKTQASYERESAAQAIGEALRENLGCKVLRCWIGGFGNVEHCGMEFEVPPHEAMKKKPRLIGPRKPKGPVEMFNDETILSESARAKTAHDAQPK